MTEAMVTLELSVLVKAAKCPIILPTCLAYNALFCF